MKTTYEIYVGGDNLGNYIEWEGDYVAILSVEVIQLMVKLKIIMRLLYGKEMETYLIYLPNQKTAKLVMSFPS